MTKYPFQPDILDALPEELAELYRNLEMTLLEEICSRLDLAGELNEVTVESIRALRSHGISLEEIEKAIRDTTGISEKKLNELLDDVVERNQAYYDELIDLAGVTKPQTLVSAATIDAIYRQTGRELLNLTQSMGFLVDGGRTMLPPAKAYQWALNNAEMQIQSGAISYNQAIKRAIMQLTDSGIRVVNYESGHRDHIDVAARRAVMTGVSQLCAKYTEHSAEYLNTPYFEVSAHIGARDKGKGWANHKEWQGKVYSTRDHDKYPNIYGVCGLGRVDGLEGANCRHIRTAFVDGVMERTYTDKQLSHIDDGRDANFEGRHYSAYEATQKQRQIERTVRKLERRKTAFEAQGNTEEAQAARIKIRRLRKEYKAFSTAADLPLQTERMKVIR
jgi:DNA-binding transcriptional MerR regulator